MDKRPTDVSKTAGTQKPSHVHGGEVGAIAGEVAGAVLGSVAGPVGAIAGMVIGAAAGTLVGEVLDREATRAHTHDEELDEAIGVSGGDLGSLRPAKPSHVALGTDHEVPTAAIVPEFKLEHRPPPGAT
jgi:uncharacterized membrane protein